MSLTVTDNDGDFSTASQSVTVVAPPLVTMHVSEMNGTSAQSRRGWKATATITVHDSNGEAVSGATIRGRWSSGVKGRNSCVTNASGECSVIKNNIKIKNSSVIFTVKNIAHLSHAYDPDSNITSSITIDRPHLASTIHVNEMRTKSLQKGKRWSAAVTIMVKDNYGNPVSRAMVRGSWSNGMKGKKSCITKASGRCTIANKNVKINGSSIMFTVQDVKHSSYTHDAGNNIISSITLSK